MILAFAVQTGTTAAQLPDLHLGGRIVFASERDGNSEIYVMDPDGTNQTRLTTNSTFECRAVWSPAGTQIAFETNAGTGGDMEAYVMNADGSAQIALTTGLANDDMVSWSPDGTHLVFVSDRDGNDEIYVMDAEGANPTRLTFENEVDDSPKWSPDGSKIVFRSFRDGGAPEIYVMDADGSNQINLTGNPAHDGNPFWSPDGMRIGFSSDRDGSLDIYVMNADGSDPVRLTNNPGIEVGNSFSADGTKIVYQADLYGPNEIFTMNANGSGQTQLTNNSAIDQVPSWGEAFRQIGASRIGFPVVRAMVVENAGSAVLNVLSISSSRSEFTVSPNTFSVAPGGSQSVAVTFIPTAEGAQYSTLTLTSNDADFPVTSLIVNGIGLEITPPSVPVDLSAHPGSRQIGLLWSPNAEPDFSHCVLYRSLSSGFTPVATDSIARISHPINYYTDTGLTAGTYYYRLVAVDLLGNRSAPSAEASASPTPTYSQSATALSFGSIPVGTASTQTFEISNPDTTGLVVSMVVSGADATQFQVNPASFLLNPGGAPQVVQVVEVTFSPTAGGPASAELVISHNAPGSPARVALDGAASGPGGSAILITPNPVILNSTRVGSSSQQVFMVTNIGIGRLQVTSIAESAGDTGEFSLSPTSFALTAGKSQDVVVTFAPASVGGKSLLITINHDASGSPSTLAVTGSGVLIGPEIALSDTLLDLGKIPVGQSSSSTLSIANSGNDVLQLNIAEASGDTASFSALPATASIAPGETQVINILFQPTAPGPKSAVLAIAHNAPGGTAQVRLTGSGKGGKKPTAPLPAISALAPNHPNPFNPETIIPYQLGEAAPVRLEIYNLSGQKVRTLVDAVETAGNHEVRWDGRDDRGGLVGSGIYVYRLQLGTRSMSRRLAVLR
ncbi:MAG: choice-of-anchor D domain-containing protein [Candidatus Latescibacteria bacterium]|nr:choice-of-anchor D domain-containing protein [Candidatus Latescibacterota bacterium]